MEIIEAKVMHDFYDGVITGENVTSSKKLFSQISSIYKNPQNVNPDELMYTVYTYEQGDTSQKGNLFWGLTVLEPVKVNGECNMTRGHFHSDRNCAEFYFGAGGKGLLLLMDENGKVWAEKITKGSLHHIDGKIAHRLINTGEEPLKVGACWPTTAGHDYEAIENNPFGIRVFVKNNKIITEERE